MSELTSDTSQRPEPLPQVTVEAPGELIREWVLAEQGCIGADLAELDGRRPSPRDPEAVARFLAHVQDLTDRYYGANRVVRLLDRVSIVDKEI